MPDAFQNLLVTAPIIVRDFAAALRLKPFKLIAELNQLGGFAVLNTTIEESVAQKIARNYGFQVSNSQLLGAAMTRRVRS